jgi:hypothetical protein
MVATIPPVATPSEPWAQLVSLGIKLAISLIPLDKIEHLYDRVFNPHIYFLTELSQQASALRDIEAHLDRVFKAAWTKESITCLELLANTYPYSFAKFREPAN